jgi:hypothetical protein
MQLASRGIGPASRCKAALNVRPKKVSCRMQVTDLQATGWDDGGGEIVRFFLLCCVAGALLAVCCVNLARSRFLRM